ncbi:MAG: SRPBCC family protein [Actinomycetota bacterium]
MGAGATDEIFIRAPQDAVHRALLAIGTTQGSWWPGARASSDGGRLVVRAKAGRVGKRTSFHAAIANIRPTEGLTWMLDGGDLRGRAEWWLEPFKDGTIVHYYLDVERGSRQSLARALKHHRLAVRRGLNALKDVLER